MRYVDEHGADNGLWLQRTQLERIERIMEKEQLIKLFVEEVWDAVWRLQVGSGLTPQEVVGALKQVEALVQLGEKSSQEEEGEDG